MTDSVAVKVLNRDFLEENCENKKNHTKVAKEGRKQMQESRLIDTTHSTRNGLVISFKSD